jgi:hypothetical protein
MGVVRRRPEAVTSAPTASGASPFGTASLSPRARAAWRPPDRRPIYEWAADHLTLPTTYAIPGRFDVSVTRPLIDVFDAIQNPLVRRVYFRAPPRFGKSLIVDVSIPWILCNDPGPTCAYFPSQDFADQRMREKLASLWSSCRPLQEIMPRGLHDRTKNAIYFGPFFFVALGLSAANLQGKGLRWVFNDEVWLRDWQAVYEQAVARTRDYARTQCEKIVNVSQAGVAGDVEDRCYSTGDQSLWHYRSPANGKFYPLTLHGKRPDGTRYGLVWSDDAKRLDGTINLSRAIETARYVCRETGYTWTDGPATIAEWNRDGRYVAQNPTAPASIRSFAVSALLNNTFADLITRKIAALHQSASGDMNGLKTYAQQDECRPWTEEFLTVEIQTAANEYFTDPANAEKPGYLWPLNPLDPRPFSEQLPSLLAQKLPGERFRTLMADRQHGIAGDTPHRWCEIRAWFPGGDSKQLHFGRVDTKEAMRELQQRYGILDRCVWQDARFEKHLVFEECAAYGWLACMGDVKTSWLHQLRNPAGAHLPPQKIRLPYSPCQQTIVLGRRVNYLWFSSDYCKDILANLLAGRGVPHLHPVDVIPAYLEHLKAEHKVQKAGRYTWEKAHSTKANHGWDTSVQGIAFALLMKLLAMPKKPDGEDAERSTPNA